MVLDKSFSGSGDNHPNYQNVQVNVSLDKRGGSVRSRYYTNQGGREKSTVLTLDQSKQAAASVLGHMRGEIAKRRIVAKKEMGDFLKA